MAKTGYEKYGLSPVDDSPDYSKHGLGPIDDSSQPEPKKQSAYDWQPDPSKMAPAAPLQTYGQRVLQNIKNDFNPANSAAVQMGEGVLNSPTTIGNNLKSSFGYTPNFQNAVTPSNPNSLAYGLGQAALPTAAASAIGGPIEGALGARAATPYLLKGAQNALARGISGFATAPLFGAKPLVGAGLNAILPPAINAALWPFSHPLQRAALSMANRGLNTPEEGAQVWRNQFNNQPGVPIGELSQSEPLKNMNELLKYSPFSGAQKESDTLNKTLAMQKADAMGDSTVEAQNRLHALQNNPVVQPQPIDQVSKDANEQVNLLNTAKNKSDAPGELSQGVQDAAKEQKVIGNKLYDKVDNNQKLGEAFNPAYMPNYAAVANDLNDNSENLLKTYGSDSDVDRTVRDEVNKAQNFLKGGRNHITVGDARARNSTLGEAAAGAKQSGNYQTAAMLQNIRNAFNTDFKASLQKVNPQMANDLQTANEHWAKNVSPFYRQGNIRDAFNGKTIEGGSLANNLLTGNNEDIWHMLPDKMKDLTTHLAITGGKGGSGAGIYKGGAQDVAKKWGNLSNFAKSKIMEYRPELHDYMEDLRDEIGNQSKHQNLQEQMFKGSSQIHTNDIKKAQEDLEKSQNEHSSALNTAQSGTEGNKYKVKNLVKYGGAPIAAAALGHFVHPGVLGGMATFAGATALARSFSKAMSSPEVRNAFLHATPIQQHEIVNALRSDALRRGAYGGILSKTNTQNK